MYNIQRATNDQFGANRVDIQTALRKYSVGSVTVLVCRREGHEVDTAGGRKLFVFGASACETRIGHRVLYTQIMPNGKTKNEGQVLHIDNVINCNNGRMLTSVKGNWLGRDEKRSVWVVK